MNFSDIYYLLSDYSVGKILLSLCALGISILLKGRLSQKKFRRIVALLPFIVGIVLNLVFALVVGNNEQFGTVFKNGISTGSVATVIYTALYGFANPLDDYEEVTLDSLIIEGLLAGYVTDGNLTQISQICTQILQECLDEDSEIEKLKQAIESLTTASSAEAEMLAKILHNVLTATE